IMVEGNRRADKLVSALAERTIPNLIGQAKLSHDFFHQSAKGLRNQFKISLTEARNIVAACPDCAKLSNLQAEATNPRGLSALQLWQMDVTDFNPFGNLKHIHVSVDTRSGFFWATAH
ncbi:POK25 protein, partial [Brachypteracias leptosomus]|nr:POK25 protein [Brachypteracias leptosomus]